MNICVPEKVKRFKTIEEQILHLQTHKNITFEDKKFARKMLLEHNYFNVISCSKFHFMESIDDNCHIYKSSVFSEWFDYYTKDVTVSSYLIAPVLEFEKLINSKTAYWVSELMEYNDKIPEYYKKDIESSINRCSIDAYPLYKRNNTWEYITRMTFSNVIWIIKYLGGAQVRDLRLKHYFYKIIEETNLDVRNPIDQLYRLRDLRNKLCHFTPINIYINSGLDGTKKSEYIRKDRIKTINFIHNCYYDNEIAGILKIFYRNSSNYIKIKKSSRDDSK